MATQYARYIKFIRDTIVDAGFSKSSGEPNIDAFYQHFKTALRGTGLKLSKTSFANQIKGTHSPDTRSFAAMAVILSSARNEKVTVATLDSLISRKGLDEFDVELDESTLPDDADAAEVRASLLLKSVTALPIMARATIAPALLEILGRDWAYLDSPDHIKVSRLLQSELARRGIGYEAYAKVLGGEIPVEILKDIYECRVPRTPLTKDQILRLQQNMRSIDGDGVEECELECLSRSAP